MTKICPTCRGQYPADAEFCDVDGSKLVQLTEASRTIGHAELQSLLHHSEASRFILALLIVLPAALLAVVFVLVTFGMLLLFVGVVALSVWFSLSIIKANLVANSVRVSEHNFPEIHAIVTEVRHTLDYDEAIDVFIIEEGTVNAFLAKFFGTKFIILNSELVKDMLDQDGIAQMRWVIGRFVGALKAKHYRFMLLRILIDGIEKIKVLNLFILPYERATQYSGDQIGLAVCNDLRQAINAFDKFMVGNGLSDRVALDGLVQQASDTRDSFFALLARLFSSHPHLVDRYENLLSFARWHDPEMFNGYVAQLDGSTAERLEAFLPKYGGGYGRYTPPTAEAE